MGGEVEVKELEEMSCCRVYPFEIKSEIKEQSTNPSKKKRQQNTQAGVVTLRKLIAHDDLFRHVQEFTSI